MRIGIDQSGKIEDTAKNTVLAIANDLSYAILLQAKDKRLLQEVFRDFLGKRRQFVYETFAVLLYLLVAKTHPKGRIIVDKEYPGHEPLIKLLLKKFDKNNRLKEVSLDFGQIGKSSPAHNLAYAVLKKKKRANKVVSFEEVINLLFPIEIDRVSQY